METAKGPAILQASGVNRAQCSLTSTRNLSRAHIFTPCGIRGRHKFDRERR
jgi:hypothetical protein